MSLDFPADSGRKENAERAKTAHSCTSKQLSRCFLKLVGKSGCNNISMDGVLQERGFFFFSSGICMSAGLH